MLVVGLIGKSGVGKTTIADKMISEQGYSRLVTYTTRERRENEVDGVDYHFVSGSEISKLYTDGKLIELTEYGSSLYGSPLPTDDKNYVVILDLSGAKVFKEKLGDKFQSIYLDAYRCLREIRLLRSGMSMAQVAERFKRDVDLQIEKDELDNIVDASGDVDETLKNVLEVVRVGGS